jgi:hypothetical protein
MPFETRIIATNNLVIHIGKGDITYADIQNQLVTCFGDGWARNSLWDLRESNLRKLTADEVRTLASHAVAFARKHAGVKNAWVTTSKLDYGFCRMSEMLADGSGLSLAVFESYDEALSWIVV